MDYVRLYTTIYDDPKMSALSDAAFRGYVCALAYSGRHETDGVLPDGFLGKKAQRELEAAGLVEANLIHNFTGRQRTKAEMETARMAKSKAGAMGAAKRWHSKGDSKPIALAIAPPIAELEVEEELEKDAKGKDAPTASKVGSHIPDRWTYFLGKLQAEDPSWERISIGACVKIAQETSIPAVTTALGFASESSPVVGSSAFGWLKATAKSVFEKEAL